MRTFIYRLMFLVGCLLIAIGAVFLFKGPTQIAGYIGSGISVVGLLLSFIQIYFPMPLFSVRKPTISSFAQNATFSSYSQVPIVNNRHVSTPKLTITTGDTIFFLVCFSSIPIITIFEFLNYINTSAFYFILACLLGILGIGITLLFLNTHADNIKYQDNMRQRMMAESIKSLLIALFVLFLLLYTFPQINIILVNFINRNCLGRLESR